MTKDLDSYEKLVEGFALIGEGLQEMNADGTSYPIKILVSKLVAKMGFNNEDALDELSMIRFAVENKDYSLEKLTSRVMGKKTDTDKADESKAD